MRVFCRQLRHDGMGGEWSRVVARQGKAITICTSATYPPEAVCDVAIVETRSLALYVCTHRLTASLYLLLHGYLCTFCLHWCFAHVPGIYITLDHLTAWCQLPSAICSSATNTVAMALPEDSLQGMRSAAASHCVMLMPATNIEHKAQSCSM